MRPNPFSLLMAALLMTSLVALSYCIVVINRPVEDNSAQVRLRLTDSLHTLYLTNLIQQKDSIEAIHKTEISNYSEKINQLRGSLSRDRQRADSAEARFNRFRTLYDCELALLAKNTVIVSQDSVITTLEHQVGSYTDLVEVFAQKDVLKDSLISVKDNSFKECLRINDGLNKTIAKQNTWWRRNQKWFYLAAGATAGVLISR